MIKQRMLATHKRFLFTTTLHVLQSVQINSVDVVLSPSVRNLGVILDHTLSFKHASCMYFFLLKSKSLYGVVLKHQNSTARIGFKSSKRNHIRPLIRSLHCMVSYYPRNTL